MIGVFDSGFGGLAIHRALTEALPNADFVYLGDNKNSPYSVRPQIDILTLTCVGAERLFAQGCELVLVVCNTSSTVALRWIQQQWLPSQTRRDGVKRNVLGVVVPTVEAAIGTPDDHVKTLGLFATWRTVNSNTYAEEIAKLSPDIRVFQQACPNLVAMIEEGAAPELLKAAVHRYVGELHQQMNGWPDRVILGCTHYPLIIDMFREALPPGAIIIDQPAAVATSLKSYLRQHPEYQADNSGKRLFLATGEVSQEPPLVDWFWGEPIKFDKA